MKYIKAFDDHSQYEEYLLTADAFPYVDLCKSENELHYGEYQSIIVKYDITDISNPVKLFNLSYTEGNEEIEINFPIKSMIINEDSVEIENEIQFNTIGEYDIRYIIPSSLDRIPKKLFSGCTTISEVVIPNNDMIAVGENAFEECSNLTTVTIHKNITTIKDHAFFNCSKLQNIDLSKVTTIEQYGLAKTKLTSINLNNIEGTLGNYAFFNCGSLTNVVLSNKLLTLGQSAFNGCTFLSEIIIPSIETIENSCFYYDLSLNSITLPSNLQNIENAAFSLCAYLKTYVLNSITPPTLGNSPQNIFTGGSTIYVPNESVDIYKSEWSNLSSMIKSINELEQS